MQLTLTLRKKKKQQSHVFMALFFMFTQTWITEKDLERVIENKRGKKTWKFKAAVRKWKMLEASQAKMSENMSEHEHNTGNKILGKHIRQFLHKNNV